MKLKAKTDIQLDGRSVKAKEIFEIDDKKAEVMVGYGWAEPVVEEVKAPKAKPAKKTTKK